MRTLHVVGTATAIAFLMRPVISANLYFLACVAVARHGFAWFRHFGIERNRLATFPYLVCSLIADFREFALELTGPLGPELRRYKISAVDC